MTSYEAMSVAMQSNVVLIGVLTIVVMLVVEKKKK